jgi:glycosyltransferase involved in cell wall biosynthesis
MNADRVLVAIPAYNEAATIGRVVAGIRDHLPDVDLLVVDDGSRDATREVLATLAVPTATHLSNVGYGRAIQTALTYAHRHGYAALATLDADGQHDPADLSGALQAFERDQWDMLIGSRYLRRPRYSDAPLGRRLGMSLFSGLVTLLTRDRIYDTTSGLKVIRRRAFEPLMQWHFIDFHAEAIVYLLRLGFKVGEHSITVATRAHGTSMYSALSHIKYPLKTVLMLLLGLAQASLFRRRKDDA